MEAGYAQKTGASEPESDVSSGELSEFSSFQSTSSASSSASSTSSSSLSSSSSSSKEEEKEGGSISEEDNSPSAIARRLGPPNSDMFLPAGPLAAQHPPLPHDIFTAPSLRHLDTLLPYGERALIRRWSIEKSRWEERYTTVVICLTPFARGAMRSAFYFLDLENITQLYVAKRYRRRLIDDGQYAVDVATQTVAQHWATMYNRYSPPKPVHFVEAFVMELVGRPETITVAAERFLHGEFRKHNSNFGYAVPATSESFRCTPQAFSHFTFHYSGGQLMVCDMQGVGDHYTDPQIHTADGVGFGRGNLGMRGIRKFLNSHVCSAICHRLGMPLLNAGARGRGGRELSGECCSDGVRLAPRHSTPHAGLGERAAKQRRPWARLKAALGVGISRDQERSKGSGGGGGASLEREVTSHAPERSPASVVSCRAPLVEGVGTPPESILAPPLLGAESSGMIDPRMVAGEGAQHQQGDESGAAGPPARVANPCSLLSEFRRHTSGCGGATTTAAVEEPAPPSPQRLAASSTPSATRTMSPVQRLVNDLFGCGEPVEVLRKETPPGPTTSAMGFVATYRGVAAPDEPGYTHFDPEERASESASLGLPCWRPVDRWSSTAASRAAHAKPRRR